MHLLLLLLLQVQLNCIRYDFVFMKCINYFSSHVLGASSGLQTPMPSSTLLLPLLLLLLRSTQMQRRRDAHKNAAKIKTHTLFAVIVLVVVSRALVVVAVLIARPTASTFRFSLVLVVI